MDNLIKRLQDYLDNGDAINANLVAEQIVKITKQTYDKVGTEYQAARRDIMAPSEIAMWNKTLEYVHVPKGEIKCLDVGAGFGKDMYYGNNVLHIETYGIDNSDGFIDILNTRAKNGDFDKTLIFKGDMRDMSCFSDCFFHIVRSNASLLHLPLISKGYMADLAVSEFHRILKRDGILYLLLKYGDGFGNVDTKEALGSRFFQFYNEENVEELLNRNGFDISFLNIERRNRLNYYIDWFDIIARKRE